MSSVWHKGGKPVGRHAALYRRRRDELLSQLGRECVVCGSIEDLHFDHITPADWPRSAYSSHERIKLYKLEADAGNLRVLCGRCNRSKSNRLDWQPPLRMEVTA